MASIFAALNFAAVASDSRRKAGRVSAANQTHCSHSASLYQVLSVPMGATAPEIKAAYRRLVRVLHPDVNVAGAGEINGGDFMSVHEAYSILRDPKKRADYDRNLLRRGRTGSRSYSVLSAGNSSGYTGRSWETDQCW